MFQLKDQHRITARRDLLASLGVFVIAIPMSIGIALASGAPPYSGLISSVIGGIIVGMFSGAPLVVSGPAAGLAALVFQIILQYGIKGLAVITVFAGMFQILFGICRWGKVFSYIPRGVLNGMLAAIGLMIAAGQIHVLMGHSVPSSFIEGILSIPKNLSLALQSSTSLLPAVIVCGLIAIAIQIIWNKFERLRIIPAALSAVVFTTVISFSYQMPRVEIAPIIESAMISAQTISQTLSVQSLWTFILPAMILAIIASAETLITARAIDGLTQEKNDSDLNKELLAQGLGNSVAGFFGGIPITGVIVRSSANVSFNAKTQLSAVLHGIWVLLFVAIFPFILEVIPLTALAGVLIVTGLKLLNLKQIVAQTRKDKSFLFLWGATFISILLTNLLIGLLVGLIVSVIVNRKTMLTNPRLSKVKTLFKKTQLQK